MNFPEKLKELREKAGLTQKELAEQVGLSSTTITGYEKGNREPDLFKLIKIAKALKVSTDCLLGTEEIKKSSTPEDAELAMTEAVQLLSDFLVKAGYIAQGQDLTDAQLKMAIAIVDIIDAAFN